ncbi:MAG: alpha/beta fold hydrolase [Gammaproteobacteria bacterium]|nr:alpha/beta fold hydrolase [Gammaproteobacteria bacterium]
MSLTSGEPSWIIPAPLVVVDAEMADGTLIVLRRHGNPAGPRVVLSHANGLAADAYYPFWSLLTDRFDVVVFDFRNHGWNAVGALDGHTIATFVDDMTQVARAIELHFGPKPAIGVFHSLSGQTAVLEACSGAGSFAALVLFDPFICPPGCHQGHSPDIARM